MNKNLIKNNKGYTIMEILVVVAIMGLISSIAFVSLQNARAEARDVKRVADIKQVQNALELYYSKYGVYPNTECNVLLPSIVACNSNFDAGDWISELTPEFIKELPNDPLNTTDPPVVYIYSRHSDDMEYVAQHYYIYYRSEVTEQVIGCPGAILSSSSNVWSSICGGDLSSQE